MTGYVNLMSPPARFRSLAQRLTRAWAIAIGLMIAALTALGAWTWQQRAAATLELESLDAQYDPIRRMAGAHRRLNVDAVALIDREHVTLELACRQPAAALLGVVSNAVASSGGEVFVEHFNLTRNGILSSKQPTDEHVVLDGVSRPGYDINQFVDRLRQPPFAAVKVTATETAAVGDVERKIYAIECLLEK
jgi:hypothetical protein